MFGFFHGARVFMDVRVLFKEVRVYSYLCNITNPHILGYKKDFPIATTSSFSNVLLIASFCLLMVVFVDEIPSISASWSAENPFLGVVSYILDESIMFTL